MANTVLITGAATGIGLALARKLDAAGWTVFAGINRTPPDALMKGASERLTPLRLDVTDIDQIGRAVAKIEDDLGDRGLSLLVSNAAMTGAPGPVESVRIEEFERLMDVNFWGPLRLVQAFLPLLRKHARPRIVIVSSASVHITIPLGCAYPVSKVALSALSQHLRLEMKPFGIEVTELQPGGVATPMTAFSEAEERDAWDALPESNRAAYERVFVHPGRVLQSGFSFEAPEHFAERIYDRIIKTRRLRPVYVLGKGVWPLPLIGRLLPHSLVEVIWKRFFRIGRR